MSDLGRLALDLFYDEAKAALVRYEKNRLALMLECFKTGNPKGKKQKLKVPWPKSKSLERISSAIEKREANEFWVLKPRQVFFSWEMCGVIDSEMILIPGTIACVQAQNEVKSMELVERAATILRDLGGPLEGIMEEGKDWRHSGDTLFIDTIMGRRINSKFTALPEGSTQWNMPSLSIGWLDEFALNKQGKKSYHSASAACEGGGILIVGSTSVFGTFYNEQVIKDLETCGEDPRIISAVAT